MTQDIENKDEQAFLKTACPPESALGLNPGEGQDSTPKCPQIDVKSPNLTPRSHDLGEKGDRAIDRNPGGDRPTQEAAKRGPGAPRGNQNNFQNGSTWLKEAKQGLRPADDSKVIARRFARALIEDLGGKDTLTAQKLEIIDHLKRDKETLSDLYACRDDIFDRKPEARRNIGVLSKIDAHIAPIQQRVVNNLARLGLERIAHTIDLAPWEREQASDAKVEKGK